MAGDHSNSTSKSVAPLFLTSARVDIRETYSKLFLQPDSIHTIQDALANISQPQTVQVSPSGLSKASQQVTVLIEALPPVLVIHLKRFLCDAAAGGVVKIGKPVQFSSELEIPLGAIFFFPASPVSVKAER
jgi:ubiquitin C-terminal hydrolase